ncbi:MAG: hypothetical protein M1828_001059, partial [Chrysothrix sp. TS-e1954]
MEVIWEAQYQESQNSNSIFAPSILNPLVSPKVVAGVFKESVINNHPNMTIRDFGYVVNKPNMLIRLCTEIDKWVERRWTEPATPKMLHELRNHGDDVRNLDYLEKDTLHLLHPDYISFLKNARARTLHGLEELLEQKTPAVLPFHKPVVSSSLNEALVQDGRPLSKALTAAPKTTITICLLPNRRAGYALEDIIASISAKLEAVTVRCNVIVYNPTYIEKTAKRSASLLDFLMDDATKLADFLGPFEKGIKTDSLRVILAFGLSGLIALSTIRLKITRFQTLILVDTPDFRHVDWSKFYVDIHKNLTSDGIATEYSTEHATYMIPVASQDK